MGEKYNALLKHLADVRNINRAAALMGWDQQVNMPPGGAPARAAQRATLARLEHELFTSDKTARLLDEAEAELNGAAYDSNEASMIRVVRQDYAEKTCIPAELVEQITEAETIAHNIWADARKNNDFASFVPALTRILELTRRSIDFRGYKEHPYDALVNQYERGITASRIKSIFEAHKPALVALIAAIREKANAVDDAILHQSYPIEKQRAFVTQLAAGIGYDFNRGRLDVAVHPFAMRFSRGDARITTRFYENDIKPALFGTMHESGHAMYEQGIGEDIDGTMLGWGTSLGVHESQSRLWENLVGRSRGFWNWAFPQLQAAFPDQLGKTDAEAFYRAINRVQPSFIRVEADEATYNLHIMLRFELEMEMIGGNIPVADLPRQWNERFEAYFGMTPPTDTLGVLQDVHWSSGLIGYFPTYALGSILSVQFYNAAVAAHPSIPDEIARGEFDTLRGWLTENIYRHGRKYMPDELTRRVTGEGIDCADFMTYLQQKFGEIYGV
jgi:carboxypeptidase Taq